MAFPSDAGSQGIRTQVTCSNCGKSTSVPFAPTPGRPVFCRECFAKQPGGGPRPAPRSGPPTRSDQKPNAMPRKRMMAQGRKGHFMHDAKAVLATSAGGMEDQHIRAFLEGLFARGARTSTEAAQDFLDEKVADETITSEQRKRLGDLVERYSFWR